MAHQNSKVNLIYIASNGRSGSTLLETILGNHSSIVNVGEIQVWPKNIIEGGSVPCGCGKTVSDCSFWASMQQKINPLQQSPPKIDFFRENYYAGKAVRWSRLSEFSKMKTPDRITQEIKNYGENNQAVFQALLELLESQTGTRYQWIVDSSKDPYRLLWLVRSQLFNIKVIHLVKDPRAFVYSMTKKILQQQPENKGKLIEMTVSKSLAWVLQNSLFSQIASNYLAKSDYLLINYEKLAAEPQATVKEICQTIGCQFEKEAVTSFRHNKNHTIAGNPMRFRQGGIVLDEEWKTSFPPVYQRLTELITSMNTSRYGY
jgi:hypothetical protein